MLIYVRSSGKDVQFALAVLEDREAVVLEVKFNPDAAARFLENPKIMGISLGKSIRGNNAAVASNRPPRPWRPILRALIRYRLRLSGGGRKDDDAKPAPALERIQWRKKPDFANRYESRRLFRRARDN